jgi:hypothetical protein
MGTPIDLNEKSHGGCYVSFGMNLLSCGYVREILMKSFLIMSNLGEMIGRSGKWRVSEKSYNIVDSLIWATLVHRSLGTIEEMMLVI